MISDRLMRRSQAVFILARVIRYSNYLAVVCDADDEATSFCIGEACDVGSELCFFDSPGIAIRRAPKRQGLFEVPG